MTAIADGNSDLDSTMNNLNIPDDGLRMLLPRSQQTLTKVIFMRYRLRSWAVCMITICSLTDCRESSAQAPATAVAPFDAAQAKVHQKAWADHLGVPVELTNSIGMKFVVIPPGEFTMGSPAEITQDDEVVQEEEPGHEAMRYSTQLR